MTANYNRWFIISLLASMGVLVQFSSDNFLPSLPAIAHSLNASNQLVKITIPIFLAGLFFSQIFYGPISDNIGRRPIILFGLCIFTIGTIICLVAPNIDVLLLARFIQGVGLGANAALFRAILRDCFEGVELARTGAYLGIVFAIIPAIAPVTGGYVQTFFGWRYNFALVLVLLVFIASYVFFYLPETISVEQRKNRNFKTVVTTYKEILCNKQFLGNTFCSALAYSALMVYLTVSPFLYQHVLKLSPVANGWLMPLTALSFLIGGVINSRLMSRFNLLSIMRGAGVLMICASSAMLLPALFKYTNVYLIVIPMMFFILGNAFLFANSFAAAFQPFPHAAGMVGAMYSCVQMLSASLLSTIAALLPADTQVWMAMILLLIAIAINLILAMLKRL